MTYSKWLLTLHTTQPQSTWVLTNTEAAAQSRAKCPVLGKPVHACQWHPVERAGKHTAVSVAPALFVIFSKVTRDCRRLAQWKILEIMMENDNKVYYSSRNPVVKS